MCHLTYASDGMQVSRGVTGKPFYVCLPRHYYTGDRAIQFTVMLPAPTCCGSSAYASAAIGVAHSAAYHPV